MKAQKVKVAVMMSGSYAAFHEIDIDVMYDYTNKIHVNSMYTMEEIDDMLEQGHDGDYTDTQIIDGYLIKGKYYLDL